MTEAEIRTIEEAAMKLENIGHIFAGDKQSRRLAKELDAILQAATRDAPSELIGWIPDYCLAEIRAGRKINVFILQEKTVDHDTPLYATTAGLAASAPKESP